MPQPPTPPPPTPSPTVRYDLTRSQLTGSGFTPRATVFIQVTVTGSLFGVGDLRTSPLPLPQTTADASGKIDTPLDLKSPAVLPPVPVDPLTGKYWFGAKVGNRC